MFDVVACYADTSTNDEFWLLMVTGTNVSKKKATVSGRWFKSVDGDRVIFQLLSSSATLNRNSLMRMDEGFENIYVVGKHNMEDKSLQIALTAKGLLSNEVEAFYNK